MSRGDRSQYQHIPPPKNPCHKDKERCAKTTDPNTGRLYVPPCCRQHIKDLFNTVLDAFEEYKVTHWLDYGTLLGAVREKNFIAHDDDADFSTLASEQDLIRDALRDYADRRNYVLSEAFSGSGLQLYLSEINKLHVDIFFWKSDFGVMRRDFFVPGTDNNKGLDFPASWVEELSEVEMDGRICKAPKDPENMCEWRYGPTWRTALKISLFNASKNPNAGKKY